jgi:hypothetical protein
MDHALVEFRNAAARENEGRHGLRRRYSAALQQHALDYWHRRQRAGDGVRVVAAALGVAHWTLHRWIEASKRRPHFRPVDVITPVPAHTAASITIRLTPDGARVEGLDLDTAARLLTLLR